MGKLSPWKRFKQDFLSKIFFWLFIWSIEMPKEKYWEMIAEDERNAVYLDDD